MNIILPKNNSICRLFIFFLILTTVGCQPSETNSVSEYEKYIEYLSSKNAHNTFINLTENEKLILLKTTTATREAENQEAENAQIISNFEEAIRIAKKEELQSLFIWSQMKYAGYTYRYRNMPKSLPLVLDLVKSLETMDSKNLINPGETYQFLGYYFSTIHRYSEAIYYLKKSSYFKNIDQAAILDNIGICYSKTKDSGQAMAYFNKALEVATINENKIRIAKIYGNMGLLYFQNYQKEKAISLLLKDISISEEENAKQNLMFAKIALAKIKIANETFYEAETLLSDALDIANGSVTYRSSELEIMQLWMAVDRWKNDSENELKHRRKIVELEKVLNRFDGPESILTTQYNAQIAAINLENEKTKTKISESKFKNNLLLTVLLFSSLGFVLVYLYIHKKRRAEKAEHQIVLLHSENEKIKSENKLSEAQHSIDSFMNYLNEKNQQIEELNEELLTLEKHKSTKNSLKILDLKKLLESHLMTDENWFRFKNSFIMAYPDYYEHLRTHFSELTESNLRLIILLKMDLNTKEITNLLGISADAVKKAKQRLRKKLGDKYDSLFENENQP
jgi:tetratricopeptide (TPR) repeat protein